MVFQYIKVFAGGSRMHGGQADGRFGHMHAIATPNSWARSAVQLQHAADGQQVWVNHRDTACLQYGRNPSLR